MCTWEPVPTTNHHRNYNLSTEPSTQENPIFSLKQNIIKTVKH